MRARKHIDTQLRTAAAMRQAVWRAACGIFVLAAASLLTGAMSSCGSGAGDALARVGETSIGKATVDHWLSVLSGAAVADRSRPQDRTLREPLISFLISSQWIIGEAADVGVNATDAEAQARLELFSTGQGEAFDYVRLPGRMRLPGRQELSVLFAKAHSNSDRLWLVKLTLLASRLEQRHVAEVEPTITPAQIASYYRTHGPRFVLGEKRDVVWIVTYSEATLKKAVREIRSGKSFVSVATRVSQDRPTISGMERHPLSEKELARRVFAAKPRVITGPFRHDENHYVFEVTNIIPARQMTLAQSEASIRRLLADQMASTSFTNGLEWKWTAKTKCNRENLVRGCNGYAGAAP